MISKKIRKYQKRWNACQEATAAKPHYLHKQTAVKICTKYFKILLVLNGLLSSLPILNVVFFTGVVPQLRLYNNNNNNGRMSQGVSLPLLFLRIFFG